MDDIVAPTKNVFKDLPPVERIKSLFDYDHETGILKWRRRQISDFKGQQPYLAWNRKYAGKQAGTKDKRTGYFYVCIDGVDYAAHRLIWTMVHGEFDPILQIDHKNCDGSDNRLTNLRLVDHGTNLRNQFLQKNNTSGFPGVDQLPNGRWRARTRANGKELHLGLFDTFESAVETVKRERRKYGFTDRHGEKRSG